MSPDQPSSPDVANSGANSMTEQRTEQSMSEEELAGQMRAIDADDFADGMYEGYTFDREAFREALIKAATTALRSEREARGRVEAALKRLDAIARVEPRNAIGEVEFTDALAQSFTALRPNERPVWRAALTPTEGTRGNE